MSSHPSGLQFSQFSSTSQSNSGQSSKSTILTKNMQPQPQQCSTNAKHVHQFKAENSLSGSETDLSTSTENLSIEQKFVLRHTPRVEPQGQENLQASVNSGSEHQSRFILDQRFPSNTSSDSLRYPSSNRSLSEVRSSIYPQQNSVNCSSNRNSLKEGVSSNRSSMDVSTCSYNTLIIHNDDNIYSVASREYPSSSPIIKKDRPRSYCEQGMQEITEIPDDYLNQSHVLKHLAKEMKTPTKARNTVGKDFPLADKSKERKFDWIIEEMETPNLSKSKSQPDLTKLSQTESEELDALAKENAALKQQLLLCCSKVAKTQKLEDEVSNIYRVYEELVQSCERREKLERVARMRLQENLQKVQGLNRALKDQVDIFQTQLLTPSEHQILVAQLFTQNKDLLAAKERQDIELAAQQATLQEQRTHIGILDTALNNAQRNIRRLEDELRKQHVCFERLAQVNSSSSNSQTKQSERKLRLDYESEISKDPNRSGSSTNSESKWHIQQTMDNHLIRLETDQHNLDEHSSKLSLEKSVKETDRIIAEAKHDKLQYLEEVHLAQRKINDLQAHLKGLENRLAEKDALILALQSQKICGSSFDSYNLSTDSYVLNPLRYNSPSSINASNTSFNTTNTSLIDPTTYGGNATTNFFIYTPNTSMGSCNIGGLNLSSFEPSSRNLYSTQNCSTFNTVSSTTTETPFDNHRHQYDDHIKSQIDDTINKFETIQRGLCCFPSLTTKKPIQPLLSDEISILSTTNSDAFLQKISGLDRGREDEEIKLNKNKPEDIVLLEKQGRYSQKIRGNATGNLVQVTQTVGQNMTDISNIGNSSQALHNFTLPPRKERGSSLPPSALPKPSRSIKTSKKSEYDRLSETERRKKSQTPPKISPQRTYDLDTSSLKFTDFSQSRFCSPIKDTIPFSRKKNYGTMNAPCTNRFGFKDVNEFSKPTFKTIKNYQRLEDNTKFLIDDVNTSSNETSSLKESFLPSVSCKPLSQHGTRVQKKHRDSINSNTSNNSNHSDTNSHSAIHNKSNSGTSNNPTLRLQSKSPLKCLQFTSQVNPTAAVFQQSRLQPPHFKSSLPTQLNSGTALPPKPTESKNTEKNIHSLTRNIENRYRIRF